MPLSIDVILNNKVLGPAFLKKVEAAAEERAREIEQAARAAALVEGLQEGLQVGRQEGRLEGELSVLRWMLEVRFGPLSAVVDDRLRGCTEAELKDIAQRAMKAESIEELFPNR